MPVLGKLRRSGLRSDNKTSTNRYPYTMMDPLLLKQVAEGTPGITLTMSATALRAAIIDVYNEIERKEKEKFAERMEAPTISRLKAADMLHVTLSTLWRWDKDGFLKSTKVGKKLMYRASDIERILATQNDRP